MISRIVAAYRRASGLYQLGGATVVHSETITLVQQSRDMWLLLLDGVPSHRSELAAFLPSSDDTAPVTLCYLHGTPQNYPSLAAARAANGLA